MLNALPHDVSNAQTNLDERANGRLGMNHPEGVQLSLVDEEPAQTAGHLVEDTPLKRGPGRPSKKAEASKTKKERKPTERLTEEERTRRYIKLCQEFPHPQPFSAKQALERVPELGYLQNAYGFLKSGVKRNFIETVERGGFRFSPSAADELQSSLDLLTASAKDVNSAPVPKSRRTISLPRDVPPAAASSVGAPEPAAISTPELVVEPAPVPAIAPAPKPVEGKAPEAAEYSDEPAPAPVQAQTRRAERDMTSTLLQLSRRFRSDRYYNVDDLIVPLRECFAHVYGTVSIRDEEPPVCVVVDAYNPDPQSISPDDIDVLFLDKDGQHHVRSAASWMFLPYRGR